MPSLRLLIALIGVGILLAAFAGAARADIDPTVGDIAGRGQAGFAGDGGPATQALLSAPRDTAPEANGGVLIADRDNNAIREVLPDGTMRTVAGRGSCGGPPCGDGDIATEAELLAPTGVTATPDGGFLIADSGDHRIRKVAADGRISTVAGSTRGFGGDGGPATSAKLDGPRDASVLPDGGFLIADASNNRIRRVFPDGHIATVAGSGATGSGGDAGPATSAQLNNPLDVDVATDGGYLIADTANNRVRRVDPTGTIATVAGQGAAGEAGDGRPALRALLNGPVSIDALPSGGFMVADTQNDRVRRVSAGGTISTEAGTTNGSATGPGSQAKLNRPQSVTVDSKGRVLVADTNNQKVRALSVTGEPPAAKLLESIVLDPIDGSTTVAPRGGGAAFRLAVDENVPVGSRIDTTASEVQVTVQSDATGAVDRTMLSLGPFTVRQVTSPGAQPVTELALKDPPPRCSTKSAKAAGAGIFHAVARAAATRRRLFARGRGRFRTRGRYGSATKRGTEFLTEDRCDGTLFKVREGQIAVKDFVTGKTIIVNAGQRYFARAGKRTAKG